MERSEERSSAQKGKAMRLGLLIAVKPYRDESLPGFLHRTAEANGLDGMFVTALFRSAICSSNGAGSLMEKMLPRWQGIAQEIGTPSTRPMPLWNLRRRRFCSICLAEAPYWRAQWDLSLATACPKHKIPLRDACQRCGQHFDWTQHPALACPTCGAIIPGMPTRSRANPDEIWLSTELRRLLGGRKVGRARHIEHLALDDFHELVFRLGACAARATANKPLKIPDSGSLATASPICRDGAAMLRDWPQGFIRVTQRIRVERESVGTWKLGEALGPLYDEIFEKLSDAKFQFIRDALEKFLLGNWQAPLALRHRRLGEAAVALHRWLPIREAASRLRLDPAIVARVIQTGEITGHAHSYKSGRVAQVVDMASLEIIADDLRNAISLRDAARRLGLSKERTVHLVNAGFLRALGGSPRAGEAWFIGTSELERLLAVGAAAPLVTIESREYVCFADLLKYSVREEDSFRTLFQACVGGAIQVVGVTNADRKPCHWIFERHSVTALLNRSSHVGRDMLTVENVAELLEVKQEVAYALVRHGTLKCRTVNVKGRPTRLVMPRDIDAFQGNYILGSELAKQLGRSPKSLANLLHQEGIAPAGGPTSTRRPCRQYYWKRSKSLDDYLRKNVKPSPTS